MNISVVTCIFNQRADYFRECAASVAALGASIRWIIVDDGSSDEHHSTYLNIVDEAGLTRITKIVRLIDNVGLAAARNIALDYVADGWVIVLDSDDKIGESVGRILSGIDTSIELVAFSSHYFDATMFEYRPITRWEKMFFSHGKTVGDPFLWYDFYYHGIVAKTKVLKQIGGYRVDLRVGEDQDILLRTTELLPRNAVAFVDEIGYQYRRNAYGVCATSWSIVEKNYITTMLEAAHRRGALFKACRFAGRELIDNAWIEKFEYQLPNDEWVDWTQYSGLYLSN
jgi:glycosyltransferase involved in cell wall biosynthesis